MTTPMMKPGRAEQSRHALSRRACGALGRGVTERSAARLGVHGIVRSIAAHAPSRTRGFIQAMIRSASSVASM